MKEQIEVKNMVISSIVSNIERSGKIPSVSMTLDVEYNDIPFHLRSQDKYAIITFDSWFRAFSFVRTIKNDGLIQEDNIQDVKIILDKLEMTLCLQSKKLAFIGPHSGSIIPRLLTLASMLASNKKAH